MARKHSKNGGYQDSEAEQEDPAEVPACWLCGRPTGKTIVWHHPVPKSRGGRDTVPRHAMDVDALLADPVIRKFVNWVAKKDPDFNAATTRKQR